MSEADLKDAMLDDDDETDTKTVVVIGKDRLNASDGKKRKGSGRDGSDDSHRDETSSEEPSEEEAADDGEDVAIPKKVLAIYLRNLAQKFNRDGFR